MVLPLYLAMTGAETAAASVLPRHWGHMACHFSPDGTGLRDLPDKLPPGTMVILNDRFPCREHDPERIAAELGRLGCGSVLLDFERKPTAEAIKVADALFQALPCPLAAPPGFCGDPDCAVFLPPCPLHVPLAAYLRPWRDRRVWLDMAPRQQTVTVTPSGAVFGPATRADRQGGVYDEILRCQSITRIHADRVSFTLFDTPDTLARKLEESAALGVERAVGLFQEFAPFQKQ